MLWQVKATPNLSIMLSSSSRSMYALYVGSSWWRDVTINRVVGFLAGLRKSWLLRAILGLVRIACLCSGDHNASRKGSRRSALRTVSPFVAFYGKCWGGRRSQALCIILVTFLPAIDTWSSPVHGSLHISRDGDLFFALSYIALTGCAIIFLSFTIVLRRSVLRASEQYSINTYAVSVRSGKTYGYKNSNYATIEEIFRHESEYLVQPPRF